MPIHVDDMIPTGKPESAILHFEGEIGKAFKTKNMGATTWYSGCSFTRTDFGYTMDQRAYALKLIARENMEDCKASYVPMKPGATRNLLQALVDNRCGTKGQIKAARSIIGGVAWLANVTRYDLKFGHGILSRVMHIADHEVIDAAKDCLRYIKTYPDIGIAYYKGCANPNQIMAYVDTDFAMDPVERKSTTSYAMFMNGGLVSWYSKLQRRTAGSTPHAEYTGLDKVAGEVYWARNWMAEVGYPQTGPTPIYIDNNAARQTAVSPGMNAAASKAWEIHLHRCRQFQQDGVINVLRVDSERNLADMGTKALLRPELEAFRDAAQYRVVR
jgi:hypothetical protein